MPFNMFPYTNLHNLNLDWILTQIKTFGELLATFSTTLANAVLHSPQQLTETQKAQARTNIGALGAADVPAGTVRYDAAQELTGAQKAQARTNIGAGSFEQVAYNADNIIELQIRATALEGQVSGLEAEVPETYVSALAAQTFTSAQQAQARQNIGAIGSGEVPAPEGAVLYNATQSLTDGQKNRARQNIGAPVLRVLDLTIHYPATIPGIIADYTGPTAQDVHMAIANGDPIILRVMQEGNGQGVIDYITYIPVSVDHAYGDQTGAILTGIGIMDTGGGCLLKLAISNTNPRLTITSISTTSVQQLTGTTPTISAPANNTRYTAGELTELTLATAPTGINYSIEFTSGATPTVTMFPAAIRGLETFSAEADTTYEINILDNRAVIGSWEVSA